MKIVTILSLLLLASPVFGELTKEDLRTIVKEENAALEKRMKEYIDLKIDGVEKSLNARIDAVNTRIDAVNTRIDGLDQKVDNLGKSLNGRIDDIRTIMIALIGLVTAAIAIPQIIIAYRDRGRKEMERSQQAMQTQIDQLRAQIEAMQNTPS